MTFHPENIMQCLDCGHTGPDHEFETIAEPKECPECRSRHVRYWELWDREIQVSE